jgi:N-acetylneuraminic acid mutarotase
MLVFGGVDGYGEVLNDLWSYSAFTGAWTSIMTFGGPDARRAHSAVWDPAEHRMYVFGGMGADGVSDELWAYDARSRVWQLLTSEGPTPPARQEHAAVWDPVRRQMLVFGGVSPDGPLADLWSYDPSSATWTQLTAGDGPVRRIRHGAAWDSEHERMLVFGGYGGPELGDYLNDLWSYDPTTGRWEELATTDGPRPPVRSMLRAVWAGDRLLILGGYFGGVDYLGDVWAYDPETDGWEEMDASVSFPTPRAAPSAVWDGERVLVFGGSGGTPTSELWSLRP